MQYALMIYAEPGYEEEALIDELLAWNTALARCAPLPGPSAEQPQTLPGVAKPLRFVHRRPGRLAACECSLQIGCRCDVTPPRGPERSRGRAAAGSR
jgi:hypothetical protein